MAMIAKCQVAVSASLGVLLVGCASQQPASAPVSAAEAAPPAVQMGSSPAAAQPVRIPLVPLKTCSGEAGAAADGLVDDLEDGNGQVATLAGRSGYWYSAADPKGSTISGAGAFAPSDGGASGSKKAARATGKTATGEGAWGATFGFTFLPDNQAYDVSRYAGISFWAKASDKSTKNVRFKVGDANTRPEGKVCNSACWNHFGQDLTLTSDWQQYTVKFADLKQQDGWGDPRPATLAAQHAMSLDWSVTAGQDFDIWVDDVKLIDCK
jgi:endoglucanase